MAYDQRLAERVRAAVGAELGLTERAMFGGLAFLVGGHMAAGIVNDDLMVRVGPAAHAVALRRPHARAMDFTGRPMKGMLFVGPKGTSSADGLASWLQLALDFARTLPPRAPKRTPQRRRR